CTKCGDGERQGEDDTVDHGERCDEGEDNVAPLDYSDEKRSSCNTNCQINPYCGDGQHQADFEDCDAGNANVDADYTSIVTCNSNCQWTAHCGDNIIHDGRRNQEASAFEPGHGPDHGERCDAGGGNVDAVAYTNSQWQCNSNCQFNPFCGDGTRQENAGEACDRGAWPGGNVDGYHREWTCSTTCQVNPFCGDGSCTHGETSGNCSGDCPPPPNEE